MKVTKEWLEKTKQYLFGRRFAYKQVFNPQSRFVQEVLADLAKFCRAQDTTFHQDPRIHAVLEGRREVWLRIQHHLNLDPEQLWKVYGRKDIET